MNNLPNPNHFEISLFGKQFNGECIVIHLGNGCWGIIDSFTHKGKPIAISYLENINADLNKVKFIILTHWHDDHSAGIDKVAESCKNAKLYISSCFCGEAFNFYYLQYDKKIDVSKIKTPKFQSIFSYLKKAPNKAKKDTLFFNTLKEGIDQNIQLYFLSPSDETINLYDKDIRNTLEDLEAGKTKLNWSSNLESKYLKQENIKSVAVLIVFKDFGFNIVLTSDKEKSNKFGIGIEDFLSANCLVDPIETKVFKIPHHSSPTGYKKEVWDKLVDEKTKMISTTWKKGKHLLPTEEMARLIQKNYPSSYITSNPFKKTNRLKHSAASRRSINNFNKFNKSKISKVQGNIGQIRIRIDEAGKESIELYENATSFDELVKYLDT